MSTILLKYFFVLLKWQPIGQQALDGDVQSVELVYLADSPCPALPMPAHKATLVAVIAERHRGVLLALIDVVGRARRRCVTDAAGQALDPLEVFALGCVQLVVHRFLTPV